MCEVVLNNDEYLRIVCGVKFSDTDLALFNGSKHFQGPLTDVESPGHDILAIFLARMSVASPSVSVEDRRQVTRISGGVMAHEHSKLVGGVEGRPAPRQDGRCRELLSE